MLFCRIVIIVIVSFACFLVSATIKKVPEALCNRACLSVSEWVGESMRPENLMKRLSQKNEREFHPVLVTED